ncbi:MAG: AmmeMemoRadiSam system radical SAM enzyme [Pirellulaceae bacterium]|nr:AmmeMemoRadiSam system radical SAM enzyme [Pirellulaceae bacterium]
MARVVVSPPADGLLADGTRVGGWWHEDAEPGRIVCDLCPRECHLREGDRGFCFVRENRGGQMLLTTYGRSTGFCIDPIEKKPLNQFYPGTSVLSFGTAGCNLGCKFCQNWDISKSRDIQRLSESASPEAIARAAEQLGCHSVAFTYNDPVVWAEYAIDAARACRAAGIKTVAVTAGYITPAARGPFYEVMDAANVDLKGFTEDFYWHLTNSHLEPVKETLRWLVHETPVWTEITDLLIPRANDSAGELRAMCDWIAEALGPDVPVHFTAFHPDFRLTDRERTPPETLLAAYEVAQRAGLRFAYVGNIRSPREQSTWCPSCRGLLIERAGYEIGAYHLRGNACGHCGAKIAGHYAAAPGTWGSRRQPVRISQYDVRPQQQYAIAAGPGQSPSPSTPTSPSRNSPMTTELAPPAAADMNKLTPDQQRAILRSAGRLLVAATLGEEAGVTTGDFLGTAEVPVLGAFVTVKRQGRLRGCCGFLGQPVPLARAIAHSAQRTINEDHRFPPVSPRELPFLSVDVWLLSNLQPVVAQGEARAAAIEIGRHGLQIARGNARGLLLPGVAVENGLDAERFLQQVCLKAELSPTAWREDDTQLWTFEGHAMAGELAELVQVPPSIGRLAVTPPEVPPLAEYCRTNLLNMVHGATPNYFAFGLADGNVCGAVVTVVDGQGREIMSVNRLSLRATLPLQSTLFSLTEILAQALPQMRIDSPETIDARVGLTILTDPAMHGTVAAADLRGFDPRRQMLVVVERGKTAGVFDPTLSPNDLLAAAAHAAQVTMPEQAQVFTLTALANAGKVKIVHVPKAAAGQAIRPPGVAGKFYPADARELAELVDACLPEKKAQAKEWPAVLVPHAGLVYSGEVAADTLRRVKFPETIIIIGPKHTPHGVEWAVAPHEKWAIPGATIPSDPALARQLVEAIPGLALDAAAHAQEHAIEVELPFLARFAPQSKVVGIVLGGGNLARCRGFAAGLARVIRTLPEQPLLVISSDLNHFASDAENRRLDEIALEALETLDPERLYETVTRHHISMCGLIPAVIVLETLRELGQLSKSKLVGYATSGDITGDLTRVVGYAGVLLG